MKSRLTHLALLVLGAAGVVLTFLGTIPKYAGLAAGLLLLVTDAKKALGPLDVTKAAAPMFALLLLGHALFGCATTRAAGTIAKTCEPSTDQESAILAAASSSGDQALALTAIDALGFALCVLQRGADEAIAALTPKAGTTALALTAESYSPVLANLQAWRKAHP